MRQRGNNKVLLEKKSKVDQSFTDAAKVHM